LDSGPILFHALPEPARVDPFVYGMLAVRAAHQALVETIAHEQIRDIEPVAQDRSQQLRYTRNADFTDEVAADYLRRLPTPDAMFRFVVSGRAQLAGVRTSGEMRSPAN
jgi:hypothetical protein